MTEESSTEVAKKLLKHTQWFSDAPEGLLDALASKMEKIEAKDGHCFAIEGQPIHNLLIIEEGTLARTKYAVFDDAKGSIRAAEFSRKDSSFEESLQESVVVDTIEGRGRITGLFHIVTEDKDLAYATIRSKGESKVWFIPDEDFREIIVRNPEHSMHIIEVMASMMRAGSKSLRGLIKKHMDMNGDTKDGKKICKVLCYDSTMWVTDGFKPAIEALNKKLGDDIEIRMDFTTDKLSERSAVYAAGYDAICLFVNDNADASILRNLSVLGVKLIAMRCAGFDRVDTKAAIAHGLTVARVPAYSPYAVAEHAIALLMAVNRKISRASTRVKMANFTLDSGLMGMDIHGKTVGVMGTGKIGQILCGILKGFGVKLVCYDVFESDVVKELGGVYVTQDELYAQADVIFLMMPLLPATRHTINHEILPKLKKGVILINTARGGLIDTKAIISGIRSGIFGGCGLDVFENEGEYFFQDWSAKNVNDPDLVTLLGLNNVVLTAHQAFFTKEAVGNIVDTTLSNVVDWNKGLTGANHPNSCYK